MGLRLASGRTGVGAADVPDDVWILVADFAAHPGLAAVGQRWRTLLGNRRARFRIAVGTDAAGQCRPPAATKADGRVADAVVHVGPLAVGVTDGGRAHALAELGALLRGLPALTSVTLRLADGAAADADQLRAALAPLAPALETLRWDLRGARLDAPAAAAVADAVGHRALPALATLRLYVSDARLGDAGLATLAAGVVSGAGVRRALRTLWLDVRGNRLGPAAGDRLAAVLRGLPALEVLTLNVGNNRLGDAGVAALARGLADPDAAGRLRRLWLSVEANGVGDAGLAALAAGLRGCARLRVLEVFLNWNPVTLRGLGLVRAVVDGHPALERAEVNAWVGLRGALGGGAPWLAPAPAVPSPLLA